MEKKLYNDRGLLKWQGFLMSEHNSQLTEYLKRINTLAVQKEEMSEEDIHRELMHSYHKLRLALVQLNEVDNGLYAEDIEGMVTGFDEGHVHFNTVHGIVTVPLDSIRNVYIPEFRKWSEV